MVVVFDLEVEVVDAVVVVEVLAVLVEVFLKGFLRNTGAMSLVLIFFKFELVEADRSAAATRAT